MKNLKHHLKKPLKSIYPQFAPTDALILSLRILREFVIREKKFQDSIAVVREHSVPSVLPVEPFAAAAV